MAGDGKYCGGAEHPSGPPLNPGPLDPFPCAPCCTPQGVVEFSLCLLFAKLVSYTFLYWLPLYISNVGKSKRRGMKGSLRRQGHLWWERKPVVVMPVIPVGRQNSC